MLTLLHTSILCHIIHHTATCIRNSHSFATRHAACTHTHSLNLYLHCQLHGPATYDLCHKNTPLPAYCPCRSAAAT